MNPQENKESITTYTLRLKDDLKARMERSAKKKGWSLNTLILDIIERHYQAAGFVEGNRLTSRTGRLYEIRVDASDSHPPDEPLGGLRIHSVHVSFHSRLSASEDVT